MKKILLLLLFVTFQVAVIAQLNDSTYRQAVKNEFLKKSKNQRTTGFILLGAGSLLILTGALMINNANDNYLNPGNWVDSGAGAGLATIGVLSAATSIPFFIMSASNNKKAKKMTAGISFEPIFKGESRRQRLPQHYPALTAQLSF